MAEPRSDLAAESQKRGAAVLSLGYNALLTFIKFVAAYVTGSVSLLSEAVHSATDIIASLVAYLSVRAAARPPDDEHPYGHGKLESLAGLFESVLLLGIVFAIAVESVNRLRFGAEVDHLPVALGVMAFSAVTSFVASRYVGRVGAETGSLALKSNSQHLMVDCLTSVGVLAAFVVIWATGWEQADAVFAILFAAWIANGAIRIGLEAVNELIDRSLPEDEVAKVREVLDRADGCLSYHRLRTRHSGHVHWIEVHIVVPNEWSVIQGHDLAERLEREIQEVLPPAHVAIHVDPFDYRKSQKSQ